MVLKSSSELKIFTLLNAAFGALIILYFLNTLILRIVYSILFFFVLYFLQILIFSVAVSRKEVTYEGKEISQINRAHSAMYFLGFIASLLVVIVPVPATPLNEPFLLIFLRLPWWSFIRVLLGLFLLSIFPGYILYDVFLSKSGFDVIEKTGLVLALSFGVNVLLGLLLFKLGKFTSDNVIISIWVFVATIVLTQFLILKKKKTIVNHESSTPLRRTEFLLLCFVFVIMLFSSYTIIFSSDVSDVALGGDINRYIAFSVSMIRGETPTYLNRYALLLIFEFVAHYLTGLHVFASFVCLEFYVLLVSTSFYLLLKVLCTKDRRPAIFGAVFISITGGFASLGIFDFFTTYNQGGQSTFWALCNLKSKTALGALAYQFYVIPLSYAFLFLALAFIYSYYCRGQRIRDLLLCGLFAVLPLFMHSIFEFSCFLVTLTIFLLSRQTKSSAKAFLKICLSVLLFFIVFEAIMGVYRYMFINYLFHLTHFFGYKYSLIDLVKFPLLGFSAFFLLLVLFRKRINNPSSQIYKKISSFLNNVLAKTMLLGIAIVILILTMYFWKSNWSNINVYAIEWLPWYLVLLGTGFTPYLIIVTLPYTLKKKDDKSLHFMFSWLLAVLILPSFSLLYPFLFPTPVWGRRWLHFTFYPLIGLTAIGLSTVSFTAPYKRALLLKFRSVKLRFYFGKLHYLRPILLVFMISFSFLSYAYTIELFYTGTYGTKILNYEADAYNWILHNTSEDAVILTVISRSTVHIQSLACRKSLGYSDAFKSWPLQVLFNSRLPEALLYSLKQLDISYIFITPEDASFLAKNLQDTYLNSLLKFLPVVYEKGNITLYAVPKYPLYEDLNYVLVSPTLDFQNISTARMYLALSDDFNTTLNKWVVLSGDWKIENEELHAIGTETKDYWGKIISNQSFTNFIYEYKGKSMKPTGLLYIWGIFRYLDENNYYSFYVGNTTYRIFEMVNSVNSVLASGDLESPLNLTEWNSVKIVTSYSTIKLYINDNLIKMMQGTGLEGKIGLLTHSGCHTCYDNVKVTSLNLPVNRESALRNYQLAFNMFVAYEINFTITPDTDLTSLKTNNVYVFPCNQHVPEHVLSSLHQYISEGTHVIFLDPFFGAYDELYPRDRSILYSMLRVRMGHTVTCSGVSLGGQDIYLGEEYRIHKLINENDSGIEVLANYTMNNQAETSYIFRRQIGLGTITYVHLTDLFRPHTVTMIPPKDLLEKSLHEIMKSLPSPIKTRNMLFLPFPQGLYTFINCDDIPNLLSLKELYNYIYVYNSPTAMEGSCTAESNYVLMTMDQIKIKELKVSNATSSFSLINETLSYLNLKGSVNLSLQTDYIKLLSSSYYEGEMATVSFPRSTTIHLNLIDAELQFKTNHTDSKCRSVTNGNCKIVIPNSESNNLVMTLKQPVINVSGSLNLTAWQGIFWYRDKAIISYVIHTNKGMSCTLRGDLSLQPLYSFGGVIIKVADVRDVENIEWSPFLS